MRETRFWTWHLIAGVVILVFLGLHMLIMHLDGLVHFMNLRGAEPIEWENIMHRAQLPFFMVTYIVLLGAALYHGLYGTRILLLELDLRPRMEQFVTIALWTIGLVLFAVGSVANIVIHINGMGA